MELSTAYARIILRSAQVPAAQLLRDSAWTVERIEAEEFMDWSSLASLFNAYARTQQGPAWPAVLGGRFNITSHGPLGFAALSAPTLGEAIQVMADFHTVRSNAMRARTALSGERYSLVVEQLSGAPDFDQWMAEIVLKIMESLIAAILGHPVGHNVIIALRHAPPRDVAAVRAAFDAQLQFSQPRYEISVPAAWRQLPSPLYNEPVYRANLMKCREIIAAREHSDSLEASVRNQLANYLDSQSLGATETQPPPTMETLASQLHMTPRTLIRRLKAEGTAYREILENLRREYAERLLLDARLTVAEVGEILGYREPANFGRAFRRWHNTSPAAWRRR